jgi:GT2 family glycosyltransferase
VPLATKKNQTKKAVPALDVRPAPEILPEELPPRIKVSAVVFSYNNAAGLRRCLEALERSKDRETLEVLVVDAGSQDDSPTLDTEFSGITILRLPRYFGRTKAFNIGSRTAVGELLLFLTSEVEVLPNTIPALAGRLENDSDVAAVCPLLLDSESRPVNQAWRLPSPATGAQPALVEIDPTADSVSVEYAAFQALMVSKYFFRGINYLDERYGDAFSDAELSFQIRRSGKKLQVLPGITALFTGAAVRRTAAADAVVEADRVHGAAVFFGKHYGFFSGLGFRLKAILGALFTFRFRLFFNLVSGQKIDGSQTVAL